MNFQWLKAKTKGAIIGDSASKREQFSRQSEKKMGALGGRPFGYYPWDRLSIWLRCNAQIRFQSFVTFGEFLFDRFRIS